jgi:DNA-directed RNA polymerase specialized sigma24 family protein
VTTVKRQRTTPEGKATASRRRIGRARLGIFYREMFAPLVRRARLKHGLCGEDSRDVVQETFARAIDKMPSNADAALWLVRTVDRLAWNLKRKRARRAHLLTNWSATEPVEKEPEETDA